MSQGFASGGSTGLTDSQLRATPVPVSATDLDIRNLTFAADKVDASGSTVAVSNFPTTQPISAVSLPLPAGAATAANQQTNALTDAQLRASAVPVSGPLTDAQLRATSVPVTPQDELIEPPTSVTVTASGNTIFRAPAAGKKVQMWWYQVTADPDNSAKTVAGFRFGAAGTLFGTTALSQYGGTIAHHFRGGKAYVEGAVNETLFVNLSAAQTVYVNAETKEV